MGVYKQAENLKTWLNELGIAYTVRGTASMYITVDCVEDYVTLRIADHAQPVDNNGKSTGGYFVDRDGFGDRKDAADFSVHPKGATVAQAKAFLRRKLGDRYTAAASTAKAAKIARHERITASRAWELAEMQTRLSAASPSELDELWNPAYPTAGSLRDFLLRRIADLETTHA